MTKTLHLILGLIIWLQLEEKRIYDGIFRGNGDANPYEIRQELTDTMNEKAYVYRNETDLVAGLKENS